MSDTPNNGHVDFGVLRRNPNEGGQSNLMRAGFGRRRAFRMVEFNSSESFDLDRFGAELKKPMGGFSWVVGNRGSGKSEIIAHLIRKQISEQGSSRVPRLPLYISIAKGGTGDSDIDFDHINRVSRESLIEAVEYLYKEGENNPEHYKTLRRFLSHGDFRNMLLKDLNHPHRLVDGVPREVSLSNIMQAISLTPAKNAFRVTLYIDDLDKLDPETAARFLSTSQLDLENLVGAGVRVVSSVSRDFMTQARENLGLSFCGLHQWSQNPLEIIQVPDLSELNSAEVLQLIKRRIHYMHFDEESGSWVTDFSQKPHVNLSDALDDPNWSTYDIRDMRRNSAITTLLSWLSRRNKTYTRDALITIESILNSCPPGSAKRQLQSRQIENHLKQHDVKERREVLEEISKRIKGIDVDVLRKERESLSERSWRNALEATNQAITLEAWDAKIANKSAFDLLKAEFPLRHKDQTSAIMNFLNFVVEMSDEGPEKKILPNVIARNPDDLFSLIRHSQMDHIIEQEIISQGARAVEQETGTSKKYGLILDDILESLKNDWKTEFAIKQIEPAQERQLADDLALQLVYSIKDYPARPNRGHKPWKDIAKIIEKEGVAARTQFKRSLMQYLALRVDPESAEELNFLIRLQHALSGDMTLHLLEGPVWRDSAELFERVISRNSEVFTKRWADKLAEKCNRSFPWENSFVIKADAKDKVSSPPLTASTLGQDLKISQPVTFRIEPTEYVGKFHHLLTEGPLPANSEPSLPEDWEKTQIDFPDNEIGVMAHLTQMLGIFSKLMATFLFEGFVDDNHRLKILTDSKNSSFETKVIVDLKAPQMSHNLFENSPCLDKLIFSGKTIHASDHPIISYHLSTGMKAAAHGQISTTIQLAHCIPGLKSFTINPWNMRVPCFLDELEMQKLPHHVPIPAELWVGPPLAINRVKPLEGEEE